MYNTYIENQNGEFMIYSYTRVSTLKDQTTVNQDLLISSAGFTIDKTFSENGVSGGKAAFERPEFKKLMEVVKEQDTVVCVSVDRLGRSASDVLKTVEYFKEKNVRLRILQLDMIDLCSSMGKLILTVLAAVGELEKSMIIERTHAGLARARSENKVLGAKFKVAPSKLLQAREWINEGVSHVDVAHRIGVSTATLYNLKRGFMSSNEKMQEYKQRYEAQQKQFAKQTN